jgi:two-component system, cell cycle response regulator
MEISCQTDIYAFFNREFMIDLEKIWTSPRLPSLPSVVVKLLKISKDPNAGMRDYVGIVKADPAIATKILKSANSSYFGFSSQIASIERAVPLLGSKTVVGLALSFSLSQVAIQPGPLSSCFQEYWERSAIQAATADLLSKLSTDAVDCDYFLAGLLTDIGSLALLQTNAEDYLPVLENAASSHRQLHEVEAELLGFDHSMVGRSMLELWSLPEALLQAIEYHHEGFDQLRGRRELPAFDVIKATAVASAVSDFICTTNDSESVDRFRQLTSEFYGFSETRLTEFIEELKPRIEAASEILSVDTSAMRDPLELMAEANECLSRLTLNENTNESRRSDDSEKAELCLEEENLSAQKQELRDPITRLYHRQFFEDSLAKEAHRCCRNANPVGVILASPDCFDEIIETHGRAFADRVLARIARLFEEMLREGDVVSRFGDEQFTVLVHQPSEKNVERLSERLRARLELEFFEDEGLSVPITLSIGAAFIVPGRSEPDLVKRLIDGSCTALEKSKQLGSNQCRITVLTEEHCRRLVSLATNCRFSRWLIDKNILDAPSIAKAISKCRTPHLRTGELAVNLELLTSDQVSQVRQAQQTNQDRFGESAISLGLLNEEMVAGLLSIQKEKPENLAQTLVQLGLLDESTLNKLCSQYLGQLTSHFRPAELINN